MFKKLLGIAPNQTEDGAFSPSRLSLKLATSAKTNYDGGVYKILTRAEKLVYLWSSQKNVI